MQVKKILKIISAINDTGRVASDMYDLDEKYYYSQSKDEYISISEMDFQHLVRAFVKQNDEDIRNDTQEGRIVDVIKAKDSIINGLRSQVETLNDIIEEKEELIDKWSKEEHRWRKAYARDCYTQGWRYIFSEIPNDTEGQEFVDTCKKYLNRGSYTLRVKGQHIKDELKGQGRTAYGQNLNESSHIRIYIDTKKGDE